MTNNPAKTNTNRDLQIGISVFLSGLSCFGLLYYYQALLPELVDYFRIDKAQSSLAVSSSTFGMALGLLTAMFVADRYSRKKVIGYSLLSSAVFALLSSFSNHFTLLLFFNFLKGYFLAGATSVCLAYISEEVSASKKLKITGLYISGNAIGGMVGRVMASHFAHEYSWKTASEIIGVVCFIFAVLFFLFSPKSKHFIPKKQSFLSLIKPNMMLIFNKKLFPYYLTGFLLLGAFVSLYNYMAFFLVKSPFNISQEWIPYVYFLYIAGIGGSMSVSFWQRKLNSSKKILKAMSILGVFGISMIFFANPITVVLGVALFTYAFFVAHTVCSKSIGEFYHSKKSVSIAIYLLCYYLGASILGSTTGILLVNFSWMIFLISIIFIFSLIFILFLK
ncbi:MFS transporter [Amniculibacterium sp. G2-70]|uniref:MFS transporter n=1 Tax=Amniculibacterium sp. G2-70 TaxID=2767188 RepID=UPI0016545CF5|nr:MFS transporter [Amniculibacterium sp. G2-70]